MNLMRKIVNLSNTVYLQGVHHICRGNTGNLATEYSVFDKKVQLKERGTVYLTRESDVGIQ